MEVINSILRFAEQQSWQPDTVCRIAFGFVFVIGIGFGVLFTKLLS